MNSRLSTIFMLAIAVPVLWMPQLASVAKAAPPFHLEEATIVDVHRAIRAGQITAEQLVNLYSSASPLTMAPVSKAKSIRQPASCSAK